MNERRMPPVIGVVAVRVLGRYVLELEFADGELRVIDLEPLLAGPMFAPLREDYELFCRVSVDERAGTIAWPNGADMSPRTRYAESRSKAPG